jgi:hypothetical protein
MGQNKRHQSNGQHSAKAQKDNERSGQGTAGSDSQGTLEESQSFGPNQTVNPSWRWSPLPGGVN